MCIRVVLGIVRDFMMVPRRVYIDNEKIYDDQIEYLTKPWIGG